MIKISNKDIELHTSVKDVELRMWKERKILGVHAGWNYLQP